jgi:predicted DNA-binding protein (UPF0251 family)
MEDGKVIILHLEEYEAIRLADYDLLGQVEASAKMGVSRPTFTRIYESARRKVAEAFVTGSSIVFEGGKVYFDSEWYSCRSCGAYFNHVHWENDVVHCALCGDKEVAQFSDTPTTQQRQCRNRRGRPCHS